MLHIVRSLLAKLRSAPSAVTAEAFTQEFAAALQTVFPEHSVVMEAPLQLVLRHVDGRESRAFLGNAYNDYQQDTAAKSAVIARYVDSMVEASGTRNTLDTSRIVPVIKDSTWLAEVRRVVAEVDAESKPRQVVAELNADLVIAYAEDGEHSIHYFSPDDLAMSGVAYDELRSLAVANLRRLLPPIEVHSGELVSMLTAGGDYAASLLLFDELWSGELQVEGELLVAVPSRDVVLFCGSDNPLSIAKLRELAQRTASEASHSITSQLFVYRAGTFQRFD